MLETCTDDGAQQCTAPKEQPTTFQDKVIALEKIIFCRNRKLEKLIAHQDQNSIIDLSCQRLTDQDIGIIIRDALHGKKCRGLNLWGNKFSCDGVSILAEFLHGNKALKELDLSFNLISNKGVRALAEALSENTCGLQELDLSSNRMTEKGAKYLADMLKCNRTLKALILNDNNMNDNGLRLLVDAIATSNDTLKQLKLESNHFITGDGIDYMLNRLTDQHALQEIYIRNCISKEDTEQFEKPILRMSFDVILW